MKISHLLSATLVALAISACATLPPVALHRPAAPSYHAAFGASSCVAGSQDVAPVATLTFTPPTTNLDGTPITGPLTYNLYEGASATALTKTATGLTGSPVVTKTGLAGGTVEYFALTAVNSQGVESPLSNTACKTFPVSPPNAFVITIQ